MNKRDLLFAHNGRFVAVRDRDTSVPLIVSLISS